MSDTDNKPVCVVTGVGPGTGRAIVERFAREYRVAMIARNGNRLDELATQLPDALAVPCDVTDADALTDALAVVRGELGRPQVVVHNAVGGAFGDVLEVDIALLQRNFDVNVKALLHLIKETAPDMIESGNGSIVVTGNTAAYRGKSHFAGFAPTKAAQRILAESAARSLGPQGVHVAYLAIDAVIDVPWTRKRYADAPDAFFCKPADIAAECWHLAHQPRSAWTFDSVIRPFGETW